METCELCGFKYDIRDSQSKRHGLCEECDSRIDDTIDKMKSYKFVPNTENSKNQNVK